MSNTERTVGIVSCIVCILLILIFLLPKVIEKEAARSAPSRTVIQTEARQPGPTRAEPIASAYIGNKSSKKFHWPSCSYLPDQSNQVTFDSREEAIAAGYTPCGHCHP